jgi:hypothetical protein
LARLGNGGRFGGGACTPEFGACSAAGAPGPVAGCCAAESSPGPNSSAAQRHADEHTRRTEFAESRRTIAPLVEDDRRSRTGNPEVLRRTLRSIERIWCASGGVRGVGAEWPRLEQGAFQIAHVGPKSAHVLWSRRLVASRPSSKRGLNADKTVVEKSFATRLSAATAAPTRIVAPARGGDRTKPLRWTLSHARPAVTGPVTNRNVAVVNSTDIRVPTRTLARSSQSCVSSQR